MGNSVMARCSCGYVAEVSTGCGSDGPTPCSFPALCPRCREIVSGDLAAAEATCTICGDRVRFYDAPELQQKKGSRLVVRESTAGPPAATHRLNDGFYQCPKCGKQDLRFDMGGRLWD